MSPERIPALDELRESLREAARQDIAAAAPRRRRRRRRRVSGLLAVGILGAAAAAGAAELISAGEPVQDNRVQTAAYRPDGTPVQIDARASDPERKQTWVVGVYRARNGDSCALAGQLRGSEIGEIKAGVFHRYAENTPGACGGAGTGDRLLGDDRTIFYGLAKPGARVTATLDGDARSATAGRDGGFLFVYRGLLDSTAPKIDYG